MQDKELVKAEEDEFMDGKRDVVGGLRRTRRSRTKERRRRGRNRRLRVRKGWSVMRRRRSRHR